MAAPRPWLMRQMGATIALQERARAVLIALSSADVPFLLLKGPVTTQALYGSQPRPFRDVDLLVPPSLYASASTVMRDQGFVAQEQFANDRVWHARTWTRADGVVVDLHRTLLGATADPEDVWRVLSSGSTTVLVGGLAAPAPGPAALALHLALHAAQDGGHNDRSREEVALALSILSPECWTEARGLAEEIGAADTFAFGILLGKSTEPADLLDTSSLRPDQRLRVAHSGNTQNAALAINHLLDLPSLKQRLGFVIGKAFPPATFMRDRYRLATHRRVGLVLAYIRRVAWLSLTVVPSYLRVKRTLRKRT